MNTINPMAGKISKSREVLGCRKPLRLEATQIGLFDCRPACRCDGHFPVRRATARRCAAGSV